MDKQNKPKLLPCPFCGYDVNSEADPYSECDETALVDLRCVPCPGCGGCGPLGEGKEGAALAWNTRNNELRKTDCEVCGGELTYVEFPHCNCCAADRRTEDESRHQ